MVIKMKLRLFTGVLLCVLLAALMCVPALADVIWEPNDTFYHEEFQDCVYNGRSYTANGPDGKVEVLREPGSETAVASVGNGSVLYVSFTYADKTGGVWGVVSFTVDAAGNAVPDYSSEGLTGWVRMADLSLVYDYIAFAEDNNSQFMPYTGDIDTFKSYDTLVFWTYPGSGVTAGDLPTKEMDEYFSISDTYTDKDGRQWGFVGYWRYIRNAWLCLDDPAGSGIAASPSPVVGSPTPASNSPSAASETPAPASSSPVSSSPASSSPASSSPVSSSPASSSTVPSPTDLQPPAVQKDQTPLLLLIAAVVLVVVAVTGVLIAAFWKKKQKDGAVK
jgi:hypothetical protein